MIRPVTLLTLLAAMGAGLHLYQTKHAVALLDRELRATARQIGEAQERTVALAAEWAWLNEPERLRAVAQKHLSLEPMQPSQFVRLAEAERRLIEAERRLPPAGPQPPVALAVALTAEPVVAAPAPSLPRSLPPAPVGSSVGVPVAASVAASVGGLASVGTTSPVAAPAVPPQQRATVRPPAIPPRPPGSAIALIANSTQLPRSMLLPGSAQAAPMPPPTVSALGGSGSLPPPVPFGR